MNKNQLFLALGLSCFAACSAMAQVVAPDSTGVAPSFSSRAPVAAKAPTPAPAESLILAPEQDVMGVSTAGDTSTRGAKVGDYEVASLDASHAVVSFSFVNRGGNATLPVAEEGIGMGPDRQFEMEFRNRARQDIQFHITDIPTEFLSQRMESYFYFFPRINLPAIQWASADAKTFTLTLPTGEPVIFDAASKVIVGGVLRETTQVDLGTDRFKRKFAGIQYTGTGLYFRVDKRGNDPRIGTMATVYQGNKTCKIPASELFNQGEHSNVEFLFPTDAEFNALLKKKCQMSFL